MRAILLKQGKFTIIFNTILIFCMLFLIGYAKGMENNEEAGEAQHKKVTIFKLDEIFFREDAVRPNDWTEMESK